MMVFTPAVCRNCVRAFGTTEAMVKLTLSFIFSRFRHLALLICGRMIDVLLVRKPAVYWLYSASICGGR